jgi:hypothetical protein
MIGLHNRLRRHPRLGAGLWFGSCLALGSLVYLLLAEVISFFFLKTLHFGWPASAATLGACFLTALCAGSVFGARLIRSGPATAASDGYRVGAFLGLCSGFLSGVLGMMPRLWSSWQSGGPGDRILGAIVMVGLAAFLKSITYMPLGVVAGWGLVWVLSSQPDRPMKGAHP